MTQKHSFSSTDYSIFFPVCKANIILIFNQSVDKKSVQKPYKAIFNSYELLLDFLYTFSLKIIISKNSAVPFLKQPKNQIAYFVINSSSR